jgi:hypothetical protein
LHPSPRSAGADGNDGSCLAGYVAHHLRRRAATDFAVDSHLFGGDGTLDHQHILAGVTFHGIVQSFFHLGAGRGRQRLVVIERNQLQDELCQIRVVGTQQRLGAAGTFLEVQPDDGRLHPGSYGLRNCVCRAEGQAYCGCRHDDGL